MAAASTYRFGQFELDLRSYELKRDSQPLRLEKIPMELLIFLVEHHGELITREQIIERLWGKEVFLDTEQGINTAIRKVRQVLRDDPEKPQFLETVVGKGYRFISNVTLIPTESAASRDRVLPESKSGRPRRLWLFGTVAGLLVATAVVWMLWPKIDRALRGRPTSALRSIAVLPLENLSGDASQEYFADGMTDELITDLAKISSLRIISRTSIMQYKGVRKPLPEIARELNVDAVVEGTVTRSGNHLRITAQLIDASTEGHLWAENYDRELGDAVTLQNQVATSIAEQVRAKLTPIEREQLAVRQPVSPVAYELNLKGGYFLGKLNQESVDRAIDYFQRAIDHDPTYAAPYSGLAVCYIVLGSIDLGVRPPSVVAPKARAAALKALQLDPLLADAHSSLAYLKLTYDWDWVGAETEFERALELNPGSSDGHHLYAHLLVSGGRPDKALAESRRALELDPLNPLVNLHLGWHYLYSRHYDQAIDQLAKTLELDANYVPGHWYRGLAYEQNKMYTEALREMTRAKDLFPNNLALQADIGHVYAISGNSAEAEKVIAHLKQESKRRYVSSYEIALIYVGLEKNDQAMEWLNKALSERCDQMIYLNADPRLDPVRSDPRFRDLVRQVGIPS
jgi:TolB-like protein/DNA-binding winged helix-turn-helix (wHTH) protein/Tfp pilus assembly protein PilF